MPQILIEILWFALGLVLLVKGGDWFVDAATGIAHRFKMPEILIGATVVSIGTTIPEVMVSSTAAVTGSSAIAYGNAIGSIICNTALISAITMTFRPDVVDKKAIRTPVLFFFGAAIFYSIVAYSTGYFSRPVGITLLLVFIVYISLSVKKAKAAAKAGKEGVKAEATPAETDVPKETTAEATPAETDVPKETTAEAPETETPKEVPVKEDSIHKNIVFLVLGATLIAFGADFLVEHGTNLATLIGIPQSVIALTFVALGTSLPELVTAITALVKGHSDLSLGNVIGANLFNLILVSGMASTIRPFQIPVEKQLLGMNASLVVDVPVMLLVSLIMCLPAFIKGKLYRAQGISLLAIYFAYIIFQFV